MTNRITDETSTEDGVTVPAYEFWFSACGGGEVMDPPEGDGVIPPGDVGDGPDDVSGEGDGEDSGVAAGD